MRPCRPDRHARRDPRAPRRCRFLTRSRRPPTPWAATSSAMPGYAVSTIEEMPDVPTFADPGDPAWKPIQHYLGLTAFGINAFVAKAAGDTIAPPHDEADFGQEEVYLVMAGHATVTVDEDEMDAPAGTVVAVRDPTLTRSVVA